MRSLEKPIWLTLDHYRDDRGCLSVLEIDFDIKRIYYLSDTTDGKSRGMHAHRKLEQIFFVVQGDCVLTLDDGISQTTFNLSQNSMAIKVPAGYWRELHSFAPKTVTVVACSDKYYEGDYIRSYDSYIDWRLKS
jgi:dTDP-4-dehydrorhamnose 3,5-epimerase-like enzyme